MAFSEATQELGSPTLGSQEPPLGRGFWQGLQALLVGEGAGNGMTPRLLPCRSAIDGFAILLLNSLLFCFFYRVLVGFL